MKYIIMITMVLLCTSDAFAQQVSTRFEHDFDQNHDKGLHLRLAGGLSVGQTTILPTDVEAGFYGAGWDVMLGYLFDEGLIVGVDHWGRMQSTVGLMAIGPSISLYPSADKNLFGSLSIGVATPWANEGDVFLKDWGLSAQAMIGQGWWVGDAWSTGFAFSLSGAHVDLDGDGQLATSWHVGVMLMVSGD